MNLAALLISQHLRAEVNTDRAHVAIFSWQGSVLICILLTQDGDDKHPLFLLESGLDKRRGEAKFTGHPFAPAAVWEEFKAQVPPLSNRIQRLVNGKRVEMTLNQVGPPHTMRICLLG